MVSDKIYTDKQRIKMIDHREDGAEMIRRSGLPEYYSYTAAHHHDNSDAFQQNAELQHQAAEKILVAA